MLDAKGQRIVAECRKILGSTIPKLMAGLFEQLDDTLYEKADKSDSNTLQTSFFDAMRVLRKERVQIDREFLDQLLRVYDHYWQTGEVLIVQRTLDQLNHESEMALLDNEELEDSLAITNMISKAENRYSKECYAMSQRFTYLLQGGNQQQAVHELNPLEPAVVCNAFQTAMNDIPVELPVKLIVYKIFEKHFIHFLGGLYDEVNLLLGKAGIIPNLTPRVRRNPVAPAVERGSTGRETAQPETQLTADNTHRRDETASGTDRMQGEVFATLQQLLGLRRATMSDSLLASSLITTGASGLPLPAVDTGELLGALSALQQSNVLILPQADGQTLNPKVLKAQLADDLLKRESGEVSRSLGDADNDTIDVITMLFEFILEDFSLPDAMKALLSRLQIPMLKVAIIDKSFFSKKLHPARRLLNNLAQAAVGWNESSDRESDTLYQKIESVIKRIMNDFHDDPQLFAELDEEFSDWWEQEQRGAEVAEQRTNQVTRGKEQLRSAKQIVSEALNSRLKKLEVVPEAVMELLEDGWKDVLLLNYLRQGPESDEWSDSLAIVDRLLWSVQPKIEYSERQELLRNIPELLRNLRERLNSISFDQHKMARLFKELQNCHIGCLRGGDANTAKGPGTAPAKSVQISFPDSQLMSGSSSLLTEELTEPEVAEQDEFTQQAESLEVGDWLEIDDGVNKSRVKLSWKSNMSNIYIFVNRKGMKCLELTLQGLANRLREGTVKVVELPAAPIMDRALDAMLTALKKTDPSSVTV